MSMKVGKTIETLMYENHLNQKELAKVAGLTEAAISNYISGKRNPNATSVLKIAKALNTSPEKILGDSKNLSETATALLPIFSLGALSPLASLGGAIATGALLASKKNSNNQILLDYEKELQRFKKIAISEINNILFYSNIKFRYVKDVKQEKGLTPDHCIAMYEENLTSWWFIFWKESNRITSNQKMSKEDRAEFLLSKFMLTTPDKKRKASIVINDLNLYKTFCNLKGYVSYKGNLSVILVDEEEMEILDEDYISYYDDTCSDLDLISFKFEED